MSLQKSRIISVSVSSLLASSLVGVALASLLWPGAARAHESIEHLLFVPDRALAQVTVIDTQKDAVIAKISVGKVPHQVSVSAPLARASEEALIREVCPQVVEAAERLSRDLGHGV